MSIRETDEKDEPVAFIEEDNDTVVDLSPEVKEKNDPHADRLAAAEAETARLRSEIASTRQQHYGNQLQTNQKDPYDSELESINERERALGVQWEMDKAAGRLRDKTVVDEYDRKAREIHDQKSHVSTRRALRDMLPQITQEQQRQQLRTQYSDVYNNNQAITYAEGAYKMLLASGEQDGPQLLDKAMNQARIQFKMPNANYMKPTQQDKQQLSGVGGGGGRNVTDNKVRMGKAEKQMAMAMYGDAFNGDEQKAYQKWAKGPGLRAKKAAAKSRSV
jgi:hypothetical protein